MVTTVKWPEEYTEKISVVTKHLIGRRQRGTHTPTHGLASVSRMRQPYHRAVAAIMESWFALIGAHQHGIVIGPQISTQHMCELLARNRTAVLPRHAWGKWFRSYPDLCASKFSKKTLKQGAHIQLSMAATARVIWLCACVRYFPGRGLVYVCSLL